MLLGLQYIFSDYTVLFFLVFGLLFGIVFGSIPGLTAALGVVLIIPFTYSMSPLCGMLTLIAIYVGGISGGLITATLINIPGTPSSIVTCWDGYPMAVKGRPADALRIGVFCSLLGGLFSGIVLLLIAPQLSKVALSFGSWEMFAFTAMGLSLLVSLIGKDKIKGFMAVFIGLILGIVGTDPLTGVERLTFGQWQLVSGFETTALMMGLFAMSEILIQVNKIGSFKMNIIPTQTKVSIKPPFNLLKGAWKAVMTSSIIGTFIGILPGIGQSAATVMSYNTAQRMSKTPEKFGTGHVEGIVASETSNNAVCGGALVPMMVMGIPGDVVTACLLGGLMIHGLIPGPLLYKENPKLMAGMIVGYLLANIIMYFMMLGLMQVFIKITTVSLGLLLPIILICCLLGTFAISNRLFSVWVFVIIGVIGYLLSKSGVPLPPIIIGFILGPMLEKYFRMAMISSNGSFAAIVNRPVAVVCLIISLLFMFWPQIAKYIFKKNV